LLKNQSKLKSDKLLIKKRLNRIVRNN